MGSSHDTERFYVLLADRDSEYDTEMLEDDPVTLGEAPRCDLCGRFIGGRAWLPPHRAELVLHCSSWGDLAFRVGDEADVLMSASLVAKWGEAGLTGLSGFEPVEITRVRGSQEPPPNYVHVAVDVGGAAIAEARSSLDRSEEVACGRCHYAGVISAVHGFAIERDGWTGSDVFTPRGLPGSVVASGRFKAWVESHNVTNVRFEPTETYEWDSMVPISESG
jgi:hypothetical protein